MGSGHSDPGGGGGSYFGRNISKACSIRWPSITACAPPPIRFSDLPTVLGLVEPGNCSIRDKIYWKGVHFGERQYGTSKRFTTRGSPHTRFPLTRFPLTRFSRTHFFVNKCTRLEFAKVDCDSSSSTYVNLRNTVFLKIRVTWGLPVQALLPQ